jgi:cytochrome c biogenesis protein CcdA/thiol-disulfide isomerase/thioredoxin
VLVLILFALLAGAGTALSPCVLPVLPALLSAGGVGGRRRPLGIVLGLSITLTIAVVGVSTIVDGVGLGSDPLRDIAIAVLIGSGVALLVPALGQRLEAPLARFSRYGPRTRGDGFVSGLVVGGALGFLYTPCAGPILAAVTSVGAATGRTIAVALAYSAGSALALFALLLGGRGLFDRLRRAGGGPMLQRVLGVILVATGVVMATRVDVNFDQFVARHIPDVSLTASLERSHAVTSRLHDVTGRKSPFRTAPSTAVASTGAARSAIAHSAGDPAALAAYPALGAAPAFADTQRWFNTPGGRPLSLAGLRGRVVLVDFWTYTCINCIRTLPYLEAWDAKYRGAGLTIVGVHTPEFSFEHDAPNVANAIQRLGIRYPVVQDNKYGTWNAYNNEYWPADYLIDTQGQVRYIAFGEGDYGKTEAAIRALLTARGDGTLGSNAQPHGVIAVGGDTTPETYLGTARAQGWVNGPVAGVHSYGSPAPPDTLATNEFAFSGTWNIGAQPALAVSRAGIDAEFHARNVYLVLSSAGGVPRTVQVLVDGRPAGPGVAGGDVHSGVLTVTGQRLYWLVGLSGDETHRLGLRFSPGVTGFAFTFG